MSCVLKKRKNFFESILLRHSACKCQPGRRNTEKAQRPKGPQGGRTKIQIMQIG